MKLLIQVFGVLVLLCPVINLRAADVPLTPDEAIAANGQRITMRGKVAQVVKQDSGYIYINIGGEFPDHVFAVRIHKMETKNFPGVDGLIGKEASFSGVVEVFRDKPSIRIRKPEDLVIIDATD